MHAQLHSSVQEMKLGKHAKKLLHALTMHCAERNTHTLLNPAQLHSGRPIPKAKLDLE